MSQHDEFLPLFLAHQGDLRAFIGALIRDAQTREDIFQNVSLTLWESFDRYDRDRSFGAWARGIAARKVLHAGRWVRFPLFAFFGPERNGTLQTGKSLKTGDDRVPERPGLWHGR